MKQPRDYQKKAIKECMDALKENNEPVLLMASVGAGKSLILSELLIIMERAGKKALCVVNNAELVHSNAQTFREQGGAPSIYCAALNSKEIGNIVFGTPQSILNGILKNEKIAQIKFNIIFVDEAHNINYHNHRSSFMRILRHYRIEYPEMRVLGATGTNFRYKGEPIVGKECLFKKQVGNISTSWLIEQGYLVKPKFDVSDVIDFSSVKVNSMGKFNNNQLESVLEKNKRLTRKILDHLQVIMKDRFGCFIFCCTKRHCDEAYQALPKEITAIITGDTPQNERMTLLEKARKGEIKYLINVQVLTVGIDVPGFDTLLFLRPTESLVLAIQMIGRVLRLYPGKESALILDCAGNIERHSDWDDPIIIDAIKQTQSEVQRIFPCPECETLNSVMARRCIGIKKTNRCDYYFDWKECHSCNGKIDITSRYCIYCNAEIIDPNTKLTPIASTTIDVIVEESKFWFDGQYVRATYRFHNDKSINESYSPMASIKAKNMFYGSFVRTHVKNSASFYPYLQNPVWLKRLIPLLMHPSHLKLKWSGSEWKIQKKVFANTLQLPSLPD